MTNQKSLFIIRVMVNKKYQFKLEPYEYQRDALKKVWDLESAALFMDMGTGKTKVLLDNAGILYERGEIEGLLVIAPKSVYRNWSETEIPKHVPERLDIRVVHWRASATKKEKQAIEDILQPRTSGLDILVMNVDAVNTKRGFDTAQKYLASRRCLMAIDESTTIKNPKAQRTKRMLSLAPLAPFRRILTGSPVTKSPLDVYTQCQFLDPRHLGFSSFYAFRNRYAVVQKKIIGRIPQRQANGQVVMRPKTAQIVVGYKNLGELQQKIEPFSVRVLKEDVLDLPDKVYLTREVPLTTDQERMYHDLVSDFMSEADDGRLISAPHALTRLLRLQQVVCGYAPFDDEDPVRISDTRLNAVKDIIDETSSKVIIWARFRKDIEDLLNLLGEEAVGFYGDTKDSERMDIVRRFEDPDSGLRYLVANQATGGFGLTLLQGTTVIYYSNYFDLELRVQSEDRSHRAGQQFNVTYIDLVSPGTIDMKILKSLKSKIDIASEITGDQLREWLL